MIEYLERRIKFLVNGYPDFKRMHDKLLGTNIAYARGYAEAWYDAGKITAEMLVEYLTYIGVYPND